MRDVEIVTALVRRGGDLLMVRQAGPGEAPFWTVPGGRVEPGEFVTEALVREVHEETGIVVRDPGRLAFTVQVDERREGWFGTVWTWEVRRWEGEIGARDPDGFVLQAAWLPVDEAIAHLGRISWQPLTVGYLRGDLEPGSLCLRRVHADGREEWLDTFGAARS